MTTQTFVCEISPYAQGLFSADPTPRQGQTVEEAFTKAFKGAMSDPTLQPNYVTPLMPDHTQAPKGDWKLAFEAAARVVLATNTPYEFLANVRRQPNQPGSAEKIATISLAP